MQVDFESFRNGMSIQDFVKRVVKDPVLRGNPDLTSTLVGLIVKHPDACLDAMQYAQNIQPYVVPGDENVRWINTGEWNIFMTFVVAHGELKTPVFHMMLAVGHFESRSPTIFGVPSVEKGLKEVAHIAESLGKPTGPVTWVIAGDDLVFATNTPTPTTLFGKDP